MSDVVSSSISSAARPNTQLTYEDALARVMGLADFERSTHSPVHSSFHLERMGLLLERLGNPHLGIPTVHIAGTKGKGSTAAMVTAVLAAQGYKVGLYTSPHLHSAVERIRVGLEPIERREFAALVEQIWPEVEWADRNGGYGAATTFEVLTAMAFLHFKQIDADFQVIEVGLGGRLDSTNVVSPDVCVITSISLDHVATLGNTVESIAYEKAGIVKPGVPVVLAPQPDEAMSVFREVADQRGSPLLNGDASVYWRRKSTDDAGQSFEAEGPGGRYDLWLPLLGDHQLENACTAIATLETLAAKGFEVSKDSIVRGLGAVRWPARLEVLSRDGPLLAVDGAHNPYSAERLVQAVRDYLRFQNVYLIFGALGGHSANGMLAELSALSPKVLAVRSRHPRSAPSRAITEVAVEQNLPVVYESDDVGEATRRALLLAGEDDLVLGTGSLSVAAEVTEEVRGIPPELYPYIKQTPDKDDNSRT
jgi:dihydrofolate synthase/folylpolyglutamate synthase